MKCLNLGCGSRFVESSDWVNIDFRSDSPFVTEADLSKGIPYERETFDFVYHSHILEHFSKASGDLFIKECNRVLRKDGLIRIVVPDLERLAQAYLSSLCNVLDNRNEITDSNHKWSTIELFDQMVRDVSGGEMKKYWEQEKIVNEDYIINRVGDEFIEYRTQFFSNRQSFNSEKTIKVKKVSMVRALKNRIKRLSGRGNSNTVGTHFRETGEIHQWMYDRYSLRCLLEQNGFENIEIVDAFHSRNPEWSKISFLDVEESLPRKPDSLFVEAVK
jgi:predicted SAM-dependent methyltransferase